jgi:hypothetical protein
MSSIANAQMDFNSTEVADFKGTGFASNPKPTVMSSWASGQGMTLLAGPYRRALTQIPSRANT